MAETNGEAALDLESLIAEAHTRTSLPPKVFEEFVSIARAVREKYDTFLQGLEQFLNTQIAARAKDRKIVDTEMTLGLKLKTLPTIGMLEGDGGMLSLYEQLLATAEQRSDASAYGIAFQLIRRYCKKMATLEGMEFYPQSIAEQEITTSGELSGEEHVRRESRRDAFIAFRELLKSQNVDYRLRRLLGENFERWTALEAQLCSPLPASYDPTTATEMTSAASAQSDWHDAGPVVTPVPKQERLGVEMWRGQIKYSVGSDRTKRLIGGNFETFVMEYAKYVGERDPALRGEQGPEAQQRELLMVKQLLGKLIRGACEDALQIALKQHQTAVETIARVYVSASAVTPDVEKIEMKR